MKSRHIVRELASLANPVPSSRKSAAKMRKRGLGKQKEVIRKARSSKHKMKYKILG